MNKQFLKKECEELEQFLYFRRRSFKIKIRKAKVLIKEIKNIKMVPSTNR